MDYTLAGKLRA